jgi:hypothetical protein
VTQGLQAPACVAFPLTGPPFGKHYVTDANSCSASSSPAAANAAASARRDQGTGAPADHLPHPPDLLARQRVVN